MILITGNFRRHALVLCRLGLYGRAAFPQDELLGLYAVSGTSRMARIDVVPVLDDNQFVGVRLGRLCWDHGIQKVDGRYVWRCVSPIPGPHEGIALIMSVQSGQDFCRPKVDAKNQGIL